MKPIRLILALSLAALLVSVLGATGAVAETPKGQPTKGQLTKRQPTEPKLIPASMARPVYPEAERKSGVEGTVILAVDISAAGAVAGAKVDKPVDGHPAFSEAAIAAVKQWRFEPARLDGKPVDIAVKIPVKFALQEK